MPVKKFKKRDRYYEMRMRVWLRNNIIHVNNSFNYPKVFIINKTVNFFNKNLILILCKQNNDYTLKLKDFFESKNIPVRVIEDLTKDYKKIDETMIKEGYLGSTRSSWHIKSPCAWDKALYYIKDKTNDFKYFYFIEDDVYSHDLDSFSKMIEEADKFEEDLLSTGIYSLNDSKDWWHWPNENFKKYNLPAKSFNPFCRLSNKLVKEILKYRHKYNIFDFHEIMFASVVFSEGLTYKDFKKDDLLSKYFLNIVYKKDFTIDEIKSGKILHPVKEKEQIQINSIIQDKEFKNAYMFLAYKNPKILRQCILNLNDKNSVFVIHLDKKAQKNYLKEFGLAGDNIFFIDERIDIKWGGYTMIDATINLLKFTKKISNEIDFNFLLSDQHLPIVDKEEIKNFLIKNNSDGIIEIIDEFDSKEREEEFVERTRYYWDVDKDNLEISQGDIKIQKLNYVNRLNDVKFSFYKGSQWWCLKKELIDFIFEYIDENPDYVDFMKKSLIPDEMFFQSILMDSPYKDKITNFNFSHIKWVTVNLPKGCEPKVLDLEDYNSIVNSGKLFARKFESEKSFYLMLKLRSKF